MSFKKLMEPNYSNKVLCYIMWKNQSFLWQQKNDKTKEIRGWITLVSCEGSHSKTLVKLTENSQQSHLVFTLLKIVSGLYRLYELRYEVTFDAYSWKNMYTCWPKVSRDGHFHAVYIFTLEIKIFRYILTGRELLDPNCYES